MTNHILPESVSIGLYNSCPFLSLEVVFITCDQCLCKEFLASLPVCFCFMKQLMKGQTCEKQPAWYTLQG